MSEVLHAYSGVGDKYIVSHTGLYSFSKQIIFSIVRKVFTLVGGNFKVGP